MEVTATSLWAALLEYCTPSFVEGALDSAWDEVLGGTLVVALI